MQMILTAFTSEQYAYFDRYMVQFVDVKIKGGETIATTKIRNGSCVAYDSMIISDMLWPR